MVATIKDKKILQLVFNKEDWTIIDKAVCITSLQHASFIKDSAKERALNILRKWGQLPLSFYPKNKEGKKPKG